MTDTGCRGSRTKHSALGWRSGPVTLATGSPGVGGGGWGFIVLMTLRSITAYRTSVRAADIALGQIFASGTTGTAPERHAKIILAVVAVD